MSNANSNDFLWKLLIGGQGGTGKTTILHRFINNRFVENLKLTIGVEFHTQVMNRQGHDISLVLWDLAGQKQFKPLHDSYIRGASGGFVCFALDNRATLVRAVEWVKMFQHAIPTIPIMLVGTKLDLIKDNEKLVQEITDDANKVVQDHDLVGLMLTSSKSGKNVNETIHAMIDVLIGIATTCAGTEPENSVF